MTNMTDKELLNLKYYKEKIEKRKFTEYDIIGFLVLIREHINNNINPIFHDFANGTAHRTRNQGIIYDSMYNAELECYELDETGNIIGLKRNSYGKPIMCVLTDNNKVKGYNGIEYNVWLEECKNISKQFNIKITPMIAKELLVCMFSIFHRAKIKTNKFSQNKKIKINGSLELFIKEDNSISLVTSDDNKKYTVCFMKINDITVLKSNFIMESVETFRKRGILYLKSNDDILLKVSKSK